MRGTDSVLDEIVWGKFPLHNDKGNVPFLDAQIEMRDQGFYSKEQTEHDTAKE